MAVTIAEEHQNAVGLAASRRADYPEAPTEEKAEGGSAARVSSAVWILLLVIGLFFVLVDLILDSFVVTAPVAAVLNGGVVFLVWLWVKGKGLKPPSLASTAGRGVSLATAAVANQEASSQRNTMAKIEEAIPGSDLLYLGLGGITPLAYILALWLTNR